MVLLQLYLNDKIKLINGDITIQRFDAIVNAAKPNLMGGAGIDGAIHRAAGFELMEECEALCGCRVGEAKITKSYNLRARGIGWIIHAVGPKWVYENHKEEELLKLAYKNSLNLALNYKKEYVRQCSDILMKYVEHLTYEEGVNLYKEVRESCDEYIDKHPIKTIAFTPISTGVYGFPVEIGAKIALKIIIEFLKSNDEIEVIGIVCKDRDIYEGYKKILDKINKDK